MAVKKWIPGFENYYKIDTNSEITSVDRVVLRKKVGNFRKKGKVVKQFLSKKTGRYTVRISKGGIAKTYSVHQLMGMAFLGYVRCGYKDNMVIDHKNNIKTDNRLSNMQKISQRLNTSKDKNSESKITGVFFKKHLKSNPYRAMITINCLSVHLGYFKTAILASNAYNKKVKLLNI